MNIVFLHGWGMNSGVFNEVCESLRIALLTKTLKIAVSAIDLPGYGDSIDTLPTDLVSMAIATESILPNNTLLIGWSLGGLIAQYLAIAHSSKLIGVILICSSPKFVQSENWPGIDPQILANFKQQLGQDHMRTLKRFLAIQNFGQTSAKTDVQKILTTIQAKPIATTRTLKLGLDILKQTDLRQQLSNINIPCLRIYGRLDVLVPSSLVSAIETLQPDSQNRIYSKASHAPFMNQADLVIGDILSFIKICKKN